MPNYKKCRYHNSEICEDCDDGDMFSVVLSIIINAIYGDYDD